MAQPNPANVYANLQLSYDAELNRILERAARDIRSRIARLPIGVGGEVRKAQLQLVLSEIRNVQQAMWTMGVTGVTTSGQKAAAKAAENATETLERVVYASVPESVAQAVSGGLRATALAGIERDHARVPRELSSRVYHDFALTSGEVEKVIRSGVISGLSARELARDVYQYISPTVPGGASYAATRLARTEINNSFHEQQKAGGFRPGVKAVRWHLSGSHGKPDLCNVYAAQNADGLGPGLYKPGNVPDKPHPQCLCYLTYEMMDDDEFAKAIADGKFDKELNDRIQANLARLGKPTTPTAKAIAKKAPKVKPPAPVTRSISGSKRVATDINKVTGANGARVQKALEFQAKLTPRSMDALNRVSMMTEAEQREIGSDVWGAYTPQEQRLVISDDIFSDAAEAAYRKEVESRFSVEAGAGHDHVDALVGHEYGHHVANAVSRLDETARRAFWNALADDMGLKRPSFVDARNLDKWVERNRPDLMYNVSSYGAEDADELLAEIWLEYSTRGSDARPALKSVGARMRDITEAEVHK